MTEYLGVSLSALDVAPVWSDSSATQALRDTIALAERVEELGYARFWIAEHHNVPSLATAATPVLIAAVAGATSTIRVGSGGVTLPNHPPLVVAEQFGTLEALHPGRIDLGVGRAPGSVNPLTAQLLRRAGNTDEDFRGQLAELAGSLGLPYAYAHHINPLATVESLAAYRESFRPSTWSAQPHVILAALVFADDTDDDARELAAPFLAGQVHMRAGHLDALFPTPAEAADFAFTPAQREWADDRLGRQLWGSPSRLRDQLADLFRATEADELMAVTMVHDQGRRIHSYELLATAVGQPG